MRIAWLLLGRFSLRHWRLAPGQNAVLVLILSVGVGVFVAIRLANRAAVSSFGNFTQVLIGQSDWVVEPPVGTLPESILPELRAALGERAVALIPVVETTGGHPFQGDSHSELDRETNTLLGIDLVGISNLETERASAGGYLTKEGGDIWGELAGAARTWVSPALAGEKSIALIVDDKVVNFSVAGAIPAAADAPPPPDDLMVVDLPELQRLANKVGRVDRIECIVAPGPQIAERRAELGAVLERLGGDGKRWLVRASGARRETAEAMTEAFRLNLTILSLIALLVGLYLIFQALDGAVVRRRGEIATLRSLGLDESIVRRVWILESAVLGLAGGAMGLVLGWLGAQGAVRVVGHTVNALYFATTVSSAALDPREAWIGLALGVGADPPGAGPLAQRRAGAGVAILAQSLGGAWDPRIGRRLVEAASDSNGRGDSVSLGRIRGRPLLDRWGRNGVRGEPAFYRAPAAGVDSRTCPGPRRQRPHPASLGKASHRGRRRGLRGRNERRHGDTCGEFRGHG
jgi:putative ABC transport system permease protein